jgi:hypothetical protein
MRLWDYLLEEAGENARYFLARQILEDGNPLDGALPDPERLCPPSPRFLSSRLLEAMSLYLTKESRFYADPELPRRAHRALGFLKREARPSGNIDLWDCNFDSAPDTAFLLWDLIPLYLLLTGKAGDLPATASRDSEALGTELLAFIRSALEGLLAGGFHTPNHRWVLASVLAAGYRITGNGAYLERARQYLAEGIDCSEDGEYSERSAIYNAVNNQAMIMLYEELGEKRFLTYAQRNLRMMICFLEGDGSLFTANSTRQDRGRRIFPGRYLYQYRYIACRLKDPEAAGMAEKIAAFYLANRPQPGPDCLPFLLLHPELDFPLTPAPARGIFELPDYNRYLKSSGLLRYRRGRFGCSLIRDNPAWLWFSSGGLSGYCRISLGFFGVGNVTATGELEIREDGWGFSFRSPGWYYKPLEKVDGEIINFLREDHSVRGVQYPNESSLEVSVTPRGEGIDISFTAAGISGVHYCFELVFPAGIPVSADHFALLPKPGDFILLKDGSFSIKSGMDGLRISGAFADTELFTTSRHGVERSAEGFTVYLNGTTPFSRAMSIQAV